MIAIATTLILISSAPELYWWWIGVVAIMVLLLEYLAFYRGVEYGIRTFNNMTRNDQIKLMKILGPDDDFNNQNKM